MTKLYSSEEVNDYFIDNDSNVKIFGVIVVNLDGNEKVIFSYLEAVEWVNSRN